MDILTKTINQMLVVFVLIAIGYILKKKNIVDDRAHANLSRIELFVFAPALNLASQIENCNIQALKEIVENEEQHRKCKTIPNFA